MMAGLITLILTGLLRGTRTQRSLVFENLALRHQVAVLQRTTARPRLRTTDRLLWVLLSRLWHGWAEAVAIVQPERTYSSLAVSYPLTVSSRGTIPWIGQTSLI